MRKHSSPVDWSLWLRSRPRDVRRADRVLTAFSDGWHCQLCGSDVRSLPAAHHGEHMRELHAWLAADGASSGPKRDSVCRAKQRREKRDGAIRLAEALGEDSFLYAVNGIEPGNRHRQTRRRLRHPRHETLARVNKLRVLGRMPSVIAEELRISENYARRLLRQLEDGGTSR